METMAQLLSGQTTAIQSRLSTGTRHSSTPWQHFLLEKSFQVAKTVQFASGSVSSLGRYETGSKAVVVGLQDPQKLILFISI